MHKSTSQMNIPEILGMFDKLLWILSCLSCTSLHHPNFTIPFVSTQLNIFYKHTFFFQGIFAKIYIYNYWCFGIKRKIILCSFEILINYLIVSLLLQLNFWLDNWSLSWQITKMEIKIVSLGIQNTLFLQNSPSQFLDSLKI